jgi:hypothetical protein
MQLLLLAMHLDHEPAPTGRNDQRQRRPGHHEGSDLLPKVHTHVPPSSVRATTTDNRDEDWQRLRDVLNRTVIRLRMEAEDWEQAERDMSAIGGEKWSIGLGRYRERATRDRELAAMLEDELGALEGGHQRQVELDDRGYVSWLMRYLTAVLVIVLLVAALLTVRWHCDVSPVGSTCGFALQAPTILR